MVELSDKLMDGIKAFFSPELAAIKQNQAVILTRLDGLDKCFDDRRAEINARLDDFRAEINTRFDDFRIEIINRFSDMRNNLDKRWEMHHQAIEFRFAALAKRLDELVSRVGRSEDDIQIYSGDKKVDVETFLRLEERLFDLHLKYEKGLKRLAA